MVKSVLSTSVFATTAVFQRALLSTADYIYSTAGGALYQVEANGTATSLGAIADGESTISTNGSNVVITGNGTYYVWDGTTLSAPTTGPFTSIGSCDFLNQYTLYTEKDGRRHGWSDVADPKTLPGLNFATAEGRNDKILRGMVINGRWVLFKEESRETWYHTNQTGASAFSLVPGAVKDTGLKGFDLVCKADEKAFFEGDDDVVRMTDGLNDKVVSTPQVSSVLETSTADHCFYYEDQGSKFCVIRFSDRPSLVFDLATGEWHERADGVDLYPSGAVDSVKYQENWYVGTQLGKIEKLSRGNVDVIGPLKRVIVTPSFTMPARKTVASIEIFGRMGHNDIGRDVQVMMRISRAGAQTWSLEKWRSWGGLGDYQRVVKWRRQGQARKVAFEFSMTDPADVPIDSDFIVEMT